MALKRRMDSRLKALSAAVAQMQASIVVLNDKATKLEQRAPLVLQPRQWASDEEHAASVAEEQERINELSDDRTS